jgi:hypothetical protein
MKRFIMVLAVGALMAVMLVAMAAPAFAKGPPGGSMVLRVRRIAYAYSSKAMYLTRLPALETRRS